MIRALFFVDLIEAFLPRSREPEDFTNAKYIAQFNAGQIRAFCRTCRFEFDSRTIVSKPASQGSINSGTAGGQNRSTAERLSELEQLRAKGLITESEFVERRKRILESL